MAKTATNTAAEAKDVAKPRQVILFFNEKTLTKIKEQLLPAEKRKLTPQLEYLLLQDRAEETIKRIGENFKNSARERKADVAVKISEEEYWRGQQQAVTARLPFREYAVALLEDWAERSVMTMTATNKG
jgi:hypothetical protein